MRLSLFTTITNPNLRGDNVRDAFSCYGELADEVVIVDSGDEDRWSQAIVEGLSLYKNKDVIVEGKWPKEFSWEIIGENFQRGYEACTGDIVIHADLDFIFHEKDFEDIRREAQRMLDNNLPAMNFYKYQFILPDRYNLKSRLVIMVNKRDYGDRIMFDGGADLCQPSLDGWYISPDSVPETKIGFYNYEKLTKTKEQITDDVGRMERAHKRHFGRTQYRSDGTNEGAYIKWLEAQKGKFNKSQEQIKLSAHPKYVQETIKSLRPEQWGYNGFNELGVQKCYA